MKEMEQDLKAENKLLKMILEDISNKATMLLDFIESRELVGECKEFIRERQGECSHKS